MWIECRCGNKIKDTTDKIPYKARYISDRIWFDILDSMDEAIENSLPKEELKEIIWDLLYDNTKDMYQCTECGRILIENKDNSYTIFKAEQRFLHHKKFDSDLIFDTE